MLKMYLQVLLMTFIYAESNGAGMTSNDDMIGSCGANNKACLFGPADCVMVAGDASECKQGYTIQTSTTNAGYSTINVFRRLEDDTKSVYASVGYSGDQKMGFDLTMVCIHKPGEPIDLKLGITGPIPNQLPIKLFLELTFVLPGFEVPETLFLDVTGSVADGYAKCSFDIDQAPDFGEAAGGIDIDQPFYSMVAVGDYAGQVGMHVASKADPYYPIVSDGMRSLIGEKVASFDETLKKDCGVGMKACMTGPTVCSIVAGANDECKQGYTIETSAVNTGYSTVSVFRRLEDDTKSVYASVGFSADKLMGLDLVLMCIFVPGEPLQLKLGITGPIPNQLPIKLFLELTAILPGFVVGLGCIKTPPTLFKNVVGKVVDGYAHCTFDIDQVPDFGDMAAGIDITQPFHQIVAVGDFTSQPSAHATSKADPYYPLVSEGKRSLSGVAPTPITTTTTTTTTTTPPTTTTTTPTTTTTTPTTTTTTPTTTTTTPTTTTTTPTTTTTTPTTTTTTPTTTTTTPTTTTTTPTTTTTTPTTTTTTPTTTTTTPTTTTTTPTTTTTTPTTTTTTPTTTTTTPTTTTTTPATTTTTPTTTTTTPTTTEITPTTTTTTSATITTTPTAITTMLTTTTTAAPMTTTTPLAITTTPTTTTTTLPATTTTTIPTTTMTTTKPLTSIPTTPTRPTTTAQIIVIDTTPSVDGSVPGPAATTTMSNVNLINSALTKTKKKISDVWSRLSSIKEGLFTSIMNDRIPVKQIFPM